MKILGTISSIRRLLSSIVLLIALTPALTPTVATALSADDLHSIYNDSSWYKLGGSFAADCSSLDSAAPGAGAPDGAQFPNLDPTAMANAINTWIVQQNPNSAMKGLGSTIVADGKKYNVNPFLIVTIAKKESAMSDPGDYNVKNGSNSFGRTAVSGQPSFQGAKTWYYWSSVKASVDYTAPENQNAKGGGDMGAYLREQYGDQINKNNLIALFMEYAPPGENNTQLYIQQIQGWLDDLTKLATGQQPTGGGGTTPTGGCVLSTCTDGSSTATGPNAEILCEAKKYNGIYYLFGGGHSGYQSFRQNCPFSALPGAAAASSPGSPGPCATDCSGLVNVAIGAAFGVDANWTVSVDGVLAGAGGAENWKKIPIDQAQAGDIVTRTGGEGHVEIVINVSGSNINTFGSHRTGTRTGQVSTTTDYWTGGAWRWTGQGGG